MNKNKWKTRETEREKTTEVIESLIHNLRRRTTLFKLAGIYYK